MNASALREEFECPVCLEFMNNEISMCNNGHNLCKKCKDNLREPKCPVCRANFINGRNYALEKIAKTTIIKCKNTGCTIRLQGQSMKNHENECQFRLDPCVLSFTGCTYRGKLAGLKKHIMEKHKNKLKQWLRRGTESFYLYLVFYYGDLFILHLKNDGTNQICSAMKMGMDERYHAEDFKFVLEYKDRIRDGDYELTVGAPCIRKCISDNIFATDNIIIPLNMVRKMQDDNDIDIKVYIENMAE